MLQLQHRWLKAEYLADPILAVEAFLTEGTQQREQAGKAIHSAVLSQPDSWLAILHKVAVRMLQSSCMQQLYSQAGPPPTSCSQSCSP